MASRKKVLIISYYWPPSGGSGVQRWMYFSKYLSELNITPTVISVDPKSASYKTIDGTLSKNVAEIKVHHTKTFELLKLYSLLTTGNSNKGIPQGNVGNSNSGFFGKISRYIRANYFIPDARVGWNSYAIKKAFQLLEDEHFDAIITTGPPHSTHLIGLEIKSKFNIKWLADLRDPWTEIYYNKDLPRTNKSKLKDQKLEQSVLEKADLVLTVGPSLCELLQSKLPTEQDKFKFIYNGFDEEAIALANKKHYSTFTISYVGILSVHHPYISLKKTLANFCASFPEIPIHVRFVGDVDIEIQTEFTSSEELKTITFTFTGRVPHPSALEAMKSSHLLVNLLPNTEHSEVIISGKMMEYLATGNPILCFGNTQGDIAKLLSELPFATIFEWNDSNGPTQFLELIYSKWLNGESSQNETSQIQKYSRKSTAKELAQLIQGL